MALRDSGARAGRLLRAGGRGPAAVSAAPGPNGPGIGSPRTDRMVLPPGLPSRRELRAAFPLLAVPPGHGPAGGARIRGPDRRLGFLPGRVLGPGAVLPDRRREGAVAVRRRALPAGRGIPALPGDGAGPAQVPDAGGAFGRRRPVCVLRRPGVRRRTPPFPAEARPADRGPRRPPDRRLPGPGLPRGAPDPGDGDPARRVDREGLLRSASHRPAPADSPPHSRSVPAPGVRASFVRLGTAGARHGLPHPARNGARPRPSADRADPRGSSRADPGAGRSGGGPEVPLARSPTGPGRSEPGPEAGGDRGAGTPRTGAEGADGPPPDHPHRRAGDGPASTPGRDPAGGTCV